MADSGHHRKRIRSPTCGKKKLLKGEKVEVRSLEEGFQGSWHAGVIVDCWSRVRIVKYDHLLWDDESGYLTESVEVSSLIDGIYSSSETSNNCRGWIRPSPPVGELAREKICYGLCVDAYHNDAWWEGVIFDREDGSKNRKVFFPDLGDELNISIENLRITHDWDEASGEWECRGNWSFLEVIEKNEMENVIPVSIKQIWYNLRGRKEFVHIGGWASSSLVKPLWQKLVAGTINDHLRLTVDEVLSSYEFSESLLENDEPTFPIDSALTPTPNSAFSQAAIAPSHIDLQDCDLMTENEGGMTVVDEWAENTELAMSLEDDPGAMITVPSIDHVVPVKPMGSTEFDTSNVSEDPCSGFSENLVRKRKSKNSSDSDENSIRISSDSDKNFLDSRSKWNWHPANHILNLKPEFSEEIIDEYLASNYPESRLTDKVRNHLLFLGWKIDYSNQNRIMRVRYTSPKGKRFQNLRDLCKDFVKQSPIIEYTQKRIASPGNVSLNPLLRVEHKRSVQTGKRKSRRSSAALKSCNLSIEPEYCPESVFQYLKSVKKNPDLVVQLRKHLKAIGWKLWFVTKREKEEWRYGSPTKTYYSLMSACRAIAQGDEQNTCSSIPAQGVLSLEEPNGYFNGNSLTRVLRSSKRVRETGASSSLQVPRTVLSWLIDNNVVMARKNIYYRREKDLHPIAKGRITRDGIRCNCCLKIFTLSGFEAHAGSNCRQPAANLFLEDGRSLVECQMEMIRRSSRNFSEEPLERDRGDKGRSWNDHICSICRYGGELILCDQCPSSFHKDCLTLQKIPEGDWFCPSCCCGICGESQFDVNTEQFTDKSILCCHQCERQYHTYCIRDREMVKLDVRPQENWFCSKTCEKVHWGLQQLLGKPILVGHNSLTWTLIKPMPYEASEHDDCDIVTMAENYSKLNVALEVMHECFEPVKEPQTQRDLVKDVIFCRSSDLNRLNFRGFYTVLLERNDELITVATLRVYGSKVAEIPLIGTRFHYRRLGMCRILMNEIEKNLIELGVDKLVLPAAENVLNTWTTSFGFSPVKQSDRSEFLGYTFLDFQDTVMCLKLLRKHPLPLLHFMIDRPGVDFEPRQSIEECVPDFEGNSGVSEVFQEDQVERSGCVDKGAKVNGTEDMRNSGYIGLDCPTPMPSNSINAESEPCGTLELTDPKVVERDGNLKLYKRKKSMEIRPPMPQAEYPKVGVSCR